MVLDPDRAPTVYNKSDEAAISLTSKWGWNKLTSFLRAQPVGTLVRLPDNVNIVIINGGKDYDPNA